MLKKIIETLEEYNLEYNLNTAYGHINGYEVNITNNDNQAAPIFLFSTYLSIEQKEQFVKMLARKDVKDVTPSYNDFGVVVSFRSMWGGTFKKVFPEIIQDILSILENLEAPKSDVCPLTGTLFDEEIDTKYIGIWTVYNRVKVCTEGIEVYNQKVEESNQAFKETPNNYFKGFLGILIGNIAGIIVQFILYKVGFLSAISSVLAVFIGTFLYKKFGGKPNKVMIIMTIITTLVLMVTSMFLIIKADCYQACIEAGLNLSPSEAFDYCIETIEDFSFSVFENMAFTALFTFIGVLTTCRDVKNKNKRPEKIETK